MKFTVFAAAATLSLIGFGAASAQMGPSPKPKVACAADMQRLCATAGSGKGAAMRCVKSHMSEISPDCQSALAAAKARHAQRKAAAAQAAPAQGAPPPR